MSKYRWIREDIEIDFPLTKTMLYLISELEKLDLNEDYSYFNVAETLDHVAKEMVVQGDLTHEQWDRLCAKYDGE